LGAHRQRHQNRHQAKHCKVLRFLQLEQGHSHTFCLAAVALLCWSRHQRGFCRCRCAASFASPASLYAWCLTLTIRSSGALSLDELGSPTRHPVRRRRATLRVCPTARSSSPTSSSPATTQAAATGTSTIDAFSLGRSATKMALGQHRCTWASCRLADSLTLKTRGGRLRSGITVRELWSVHIADRRARPDEIRMLAQKCEVIDAEVPSRARDIAIIAEN